MNKQQRKAIRDEIAKLDVAIFEEVKENLENILEEANDAFDNYPDSLKDSDRGCEMMDELAVLVDKINALDDIIVDFDILED